LIELLTIYAADIKTQAIGFVTYIKIIGSKRKRREGRRKV
jgi:hypothetical protein